MARFGHKKRGDLTPCVFVIKKVPGSRFSFLILSTSYRNPVDSIPNIESQLAGKGNHHRLCFDLLMSNGDTENRFCEVLFENGRILLSTFRVVRHVPREIRTISDGYYSTKDMSNGVASG